MRAWRGVLVAVAERKLKRLALVLLTMSTLLLVGTAPSAASREAAVSGSTIDDLISKCPPAAEVASIRSDFALTFEGDPTAGFLVCRASDGTADLTRLQERAIQGLRAMKALSFSRPLPWTSRGLYDWLNDAIDGIRFRSDIVYSFCCDPEGVINIQTRNLAALLPGDRWVNPQSGSGISSLVGLYIHEARHNEGLPHTCGTGDATVAELGALGVTYHYWLWIGLYAGQFLASPSPTATYYRDWGIGLSEGVLASVCSVPVADLSLSLDPSPSPVPSGGMLRTTLTVGNKGPDTAPEVYVFLDETPGVALVRSASASHGSCVVGAEGEPRGTSCDLGPLASGARATITIVQRVTGKEGEVIQGPVNPSLSLGPYATGPVRDGNRENNVAQFSVAIAGKPTPSPCPGTPKGGVTRVGSTSGGRVVGTDRGDVLCSGGGATTLDGRGGDDVLRGGSGVDRMLAGPGNDKIYVRGGKTDSAACGSGSDQVFADETDRIARDCERVKRG